MILVSKTEPAIQRFTLALLAAALVLTACGSDAVYSPEDKLLVDPAAVNGADERRLLVVEIRGGSPDVHQILKVDHDGCAELADNLRPGLRRVGFIELSRIDSLRLLLTADDSSDIDFGSEATGGTGHGDETATVYTLFFDGDTSTRSLRSDTFKLTDDSREAITGIDALFEQVVRNTPTVELVLSATSVTAGTAVKMKLLIRNDRQKTLRVNFDTGQLFEFSVWSESDPGVPGDELWRWGRQHLFNQIQTDGELAPGESLSYTVSWDGRDSSGSRRLGPFIVRAEFAGRPGGSPEQQVLSIK
jgi:hypothetical protein